MLTQQQNIILSSKSPRRQELLKDLGLEFTIITKNVLEEYPAEMDLYEVPKYLASLKAEPFMGQEYKESLVITSDTVVLLEGRLLGKPQNEKEAFEMIMSLSGKTHEVVTGVCLLQKGERNLFSSITRVTFDEIEEEEAMHYIENYGPFDKAGSYGIQDWLGCVKIARIDGCYYNVMGLPVRDLYNKMRDLNVFV